MFPFNRTNIVSSSPSGSPLMGGMGPILKPPMKAQMSHHGALHIKMNSPSSLKNEAPFQKMIPRTAINISISLIKKHQEIRG